MDSSKLDLSISLTLADLSNSIVSLVKARFRLILSVFVKHGKFLKLRIVWIENRREVINYPAK